MVDFSRIRRSGSSSDRGPIHPIEIFERLPSLDTSPNDLWRGQAEALQTWHDHREETDTIIALNTGAGKTIIGLLAAQSLVNEGVPNVIYCCATIDLVRQTAEEAKNIGLPCTTRTKQAFSDDQFESGRTFCITTYQALFNGHSSLRRKYFPGAVIFDDAHVAESFIRESLTLKIDSRKQPIAFAELARLFEGHFRDIGRRGEFRDAQGAQHATIVMASPGAVQSAREQVAAIIEASLNEKDSSGKKDPEGNAYCLPYLRDRIDRCAIVFGNGTCEITPPFLPSLALDVFARQLRRIYLSATLQYQTDFVRAFGQLPKRVIEPKNDAGNGERLILNADRVTGAASQILPRNLIGTHKVLLAVPSYKAAERWEIVASPPAVDDFSAALSAFRESRQPGAFILVARVDGIDLPHDTCRIMVLDGLPAGASLFERYLWEFIDLKNLSASKIANRIAQLFGRINRGRNDYGAFLISGRDITVWLANDRNVALLPDLLQQQITLGRDVQDSLEKNSPREVRELIEQVLSRDHDWIDFYGANIERTGLDANQIAAARELERGMVEAARACANYAKEMWDGDITAARRILEEAIESIGRTDSRLAGWVNIWLAGCYEAEGDGESASQAYRRTRNQLGVVFVPPRSIAREGTPLAALGAFATEIEPIVCTNSPEAYHRDVRRLRRVLADLDGAPPRRMEESTRALGELLGYAASRPDNENSGDGPDVLWESREADLCVAFELKTDKEEPAIYRKNDDVGQGHNSLTWVAQHKSDKTCLGLIFVGPNGKCSAESSPSDSMWLGNPKALVELRERIFALMDDLRGLMPLERRNAVAQRCNDAQWSLPNVFDRIRGSRLSK